MDIIVRRDDGGDDDARTTHRVVFVTGDGQEYEVREIGSALQITGISSFAATLLVRPRAANIVQIIGDL